MIYLLSWNEWVTLPVQFSDLPRTAQLALTVYDCVGPNKMAPVGGTTISLFSKYGVFKQVCLLLTNKNLNMTFVCISLGHVGLKSLAQ